MIAAAAAIFGTIGLFVRQIPLPSAEIALYRAVLAVMAIGTYLAAARQKIDLSGMKKELILLLVSGVAMGFNWILLFESYKYTTVSLATLSYYAAPILITVVRDHGASVFYPGKIQRSPDRAHRALGTSSDRALQIGADDPQSGRPARKEGGVCGQR